MSDLKSTELMEKIVSLCKRRGFIFQSSELYGGLNGFWDYGPLGAELKRNIKDCWWRWMIYYREDVVGLEASIIMHPKIWEASGHTSTFSDLMVECRACRKRMRVDQVGDLLQESRFLKPLEKLFNRLTNSRPESVEKKEQPNLGDAVKQWAKGEGRGAAPSLAVVLDPELSARAVERYSIQITSQSGPFRDFLRALATPANKQQQNDPCPHCGGELDAPRPFNLMLKTYVGPVESEDNKTYLRPETAQAIFVQFKNVLEVSRQKLPFGIAQIGKAFRNEINPRNYTFRSREFEQMELEFFIKPDEAIEAISGSVVKPDKPGHPGEPQPNWGWQIWHQYWVEERLRFYENIGLPRSSLVEYWQTPEELAHYARATVDILYKFPFSKRDANGELAGEELEGVAARSDFDLSQHQRFAGKPMTVFDEELKAAWLKLEEEKKAALLQRYFESRRKYLVKMITDNDADKQAREDADLFTKGYYVPHVIEPSAGVDRLALALICNAYAEDQAPDEKGKLESRIVMRFHPRIAPIKVAVFPLLKNKPELVRKAKEVRSLLQQHMTVFYDEAGAIGRRYRRQDEAGTPFGVTIDFDTLGEKGPELKDTVTLRHRDNMKQDRVKISDLPMVLFESVR
ncbi:MAG TPA: glycine--tRNA ligase [Candidatus Eisenbacteria bacterium]|nr:glycine--tRNA ligase [Candidatus Eisenbacteria bacterium]